MQHATYRLVEECAGTGDVIARNEVVARVGYALARYQGMLVGNGMPVPGLHRIEGSVDKSLANAHPHLVGTSLTLRLEDGRSLAITLADQEGRILAEGHGLGRGCSCC